MVVDGYNSTISNALVVNFVFIVMVRFMNLKEILNDAF